MKNKNNSVITNTSKNSSVQDKSILENKNEVKKTKNKPINKEVNSSTIKKNKQEKNKVTDENELNELNVKKKIAKNTKFVSNSNSNQGWSLTFSGIVVLSALLLYYLLNDFLKYLKYID